MDLICLRRTEDKYEEQRSAPVQRKGATVNIKGQLGVPLTVYPRYLLCSLGILGSFSSTKHPLYRAYIGISHRGTLVGVHPTTP